MPDPYLLKPGSQSDPGKLPFYIHTAHVWSSPPRTVSYSVSTSTRYLTSDLCQHVHPRFPNPLSPRPMPTRSHMFPKPLSLFIISETDTHPKALLRATSGRMQQDPLPLRIACYIPYSYVHFS